MKSHGKGLGIDITSEFTSNVNRFKHDFLADVSRDVPVRKFRPLHVSEHPRQREMDEYRALPSQYN